MAKGNQIKTDIVIAGGGTVGMSLALALANSTHLNIILVEAVKHDFDQLHPGFDGRSVALSAHSCDWLSTNNIQLRDISCAIEHIHVSDRGHLGQCSMSAQEFDVAALGRVIELPLLGATLYKHLQKSGLDNVEWLCPDHITSIAYDVDGVNVNTHSGKHINAKLLVVAEGGQSPTLEMINIQSSRTPYEQVALIANIELQKKHKHWAFERFTEYGPLAILPLPSIGESAGDRCSLVWTLAPERETQLMSASDSEFLTALQAEFGNRLGAFKRVGKRSCYPLALTHAQQITAHRTAIVGNAAQTLHPIAGQGLNLGIRDVESLVYSIQQGLTKGNDVGEYSRLRHYKSLRESDRKEVMALTDGLVRVFSNQFLPFVVGRNIGLMAMNYLPLAKAKLATQAMGLGRSLNEDGIK